MLRRTSGSFQVFVLFVSSIHHSRSVSLMQSRIVTPGTFMKRRIQKIHGVFELSRERRKSIHFYSASTVTAKHRYKAIEKAVGVPKNKSFSVIIFVTLSFVFDLTNFLHFQCVPSSKHQRTLTHAGKPA